MNKFIKASAMFLVAAFSAAHADETIRQNIIRLGIPASTADKKIIFDTNDTTDNVTLNVTDSKTFSLTKAPIFTASDTHGFSLCSTSQTSCEVVALTADTYSPVFRLLSGGDWWDLKHNGSSNTFTLDYDGTTRFTFSTSGSLTTEGDLNVSGAFKGTRTLITFTNKSAAIADNTYLKPWGDNDALATSALVGAIAMPRAGSIVGISESFWFSGAADCKSTRINIRKNGSTVFSNDTNLAHSSNEIITSYATQDRNTDTFSAGDYLEAEVEYLDGSISSCTMSVTVLVELQFDS